MISERVIVTFSLAVSEPGSISISKPETAESLRLVATVRQESSPYPDRAVTLLTSGSILDTGTPDAFVRKLIKSPVDVSNDETKIYMSPIGYRLTLQPWGGVSDMRQREHHDFITVPPLGQGSVDVAWSLDPKYIFRFYKDGDFEEQLKRFEAGQRFKIEADMSVGVWWTWGSLQHGLKDKQFSRWSLPDDLPLVREPGQDEGDEVDSRLRDIVDHKDVGSIIGQWNLPGTPDPDDEEPPRVKEMRIAGWVFGEPVTGLEIVCDHQSAEFEFVE